MGEEASINRRLAAILAADIAGYSRLMHEDEAATVREHRQSRSYSRSRRLGLEVLR